MEEKASAKLGSMQHRPTSTRDRVEFIEPIEGKLHRREVIAFDDPVVNIGGDIQERKFSEIIASERQMRLCEIVEVFSIPEFRLDNPPSSTK